MDPVAQILSQSQGGTAAGAGFGQFFAEGVQSGQRQQQLNLASRRQQFEEEQQSADEQRRTMLFPLQMEAARINNTQAGLNLQNQFAAQNKLTDLLDLQRRFSIAPNGYGDTELIDAVNTVFKQAPTLTEHPVGKEILGSIAAAPKLDTSFTAIKRYNDQLKGTGLYVQRLDERGRPVLGELPRVNMPPEQRAATAKAAGLEPSGLDPSGQVDYARPREQTSSVIRTLPDGTTEVVLGASQGDLTNQQRGQAKLQSDKLTDTATRLGELATMSDLLFGPKAAVQNFIVDEVLANINPSLAVGQRIQGRSKAALAREGLVQSMGAGQGQLSNKDIERMLAPFPKSGIEEVIRESPIDAKNKLFAIQKEIARDAYERSKSRGVDPDPRALRMMDPFILRKELQGQRITQEQFNDAINNNAHIDEVKRLVKQFQERK